MMYVRKLLLEVESAKFGALRAHVPTCLACVHANVACVLTCPRALRAYVLTCQCALRAYVVVCKRDILNNVNSYIIQIC